jgi:hypothetical protein
MASAKILSNNGARSMSELPENTLQTHILESDIRDGLEFFVRDPGPVQSKTCMLDASILSRRRKLAKAG